VLAPQSGSGSPWISYDIGRLGASDTFVSGSASSDKMTLKSESSNLLTFGLPSPVQSGQTVSFSFAVSIPGTGPFRFDLSQSAVPEPASAVWLAVGAGLVCRN
jgi:hypothetical protein